ncbi:hypothetical protein J3R30DRAFT_3404238 [Lentinula aciculospora]|uniref:Uncharacterized protein n=1 Tax=Lentinula aciculospora TaxID=153920 RepID=A0A9W8ZYU5_9AGAR|nr:hypothetical protein J3R30DRAFT_3408204 [Lentinula aciculospora]KAJ4478112.1 hypothetical protein J3R30DRAFT_3404234 [Lentinula aciculospora]KAJ4478120.1 hypothetical protein J3R30DRAFT_3404238 [Lentinula aciculospora]
MRATEEAAARAGKDFPAHQQALSVVAELNAQLRASKLILQLQLAFEQQEGVVKTKNNYTSIKGDGRLRIRKRWFMELKPVDMDRCFVTNTVIYYGSGKEHPPEGHPKLHLLIQSNEEHRVGQAVREI